MNKLLKLTISLVTPVVAGAVGALATTPNIPTWYASLQKPSFNPPNWLFGPVWTTLYLLMGVAVYLVWVAPGKKPKRNAYIHFGTQLTLNVLWSLVFFGLHAPEAGVVVILALLASIVLTMRAFWQHSKPATYLLLPYLGWVSFATVLNIALAALN